MTYNFYTFQTINLPTVAEDTYFLIFDHPFSGEDPSEDYSYMYSGYVLAGNSIKNLNEILSQYVKPREISFSLATFIQQDSSLRKTFYVYSTTPEEDWETYTQDNIVLTYFWDYDYDFEYDTRLIYMSDPILPMVDNRQFIMNTRRATSFDVTETITITIDGEWNGQYSAYGFTAYNYIRDAATLNVNEPGHILGIGSQNYEIITDGCFNYCLYYLNQYGGWDTLLFRGKELQTDNINRLSYKKDYVVNSLDFHKVDYLTKINSKWTLNTSYLDDLQSSKMINVIGSNRLYLHDLESGRIMPVNITNATCDHKTYKNQGRKMSVYNLEVSASQEKYRI